MPKPLTVWITTYYGKFFKRWEYHTTWPASWEICMQVKKQLLELDIESPLDCREIKPVNPEGNESWIFIERTNTEAEAPILWPPDAKSWLTGKNLMLGKIEGRRRRDDKEWDGWMLSWLNGHEFEQAVGDGEGEGSLECYGL